MFDIGSSELLLIVIVAVVVIGPKDLPRVLYKLGQIIGKGRAMTRHFRSGIDEMIRQAEMEEMEKKWAADNARIMAQSPAASAVLDGQAQAAGALPADQQAGFDPVDYDVGGGAVYREAEPAQTQDEAVRPSPEGTPVAADPQLATDHDPLHGKGSAA